MEGEIATEISTPSPAAVVFKVSVPMGGGCLNTTGAEVATRASLWALRAWNPKKSRKESFGGSAKKAPKTPEKSKNAQKNTQIWKFSGISTFSGMFGDFVAGPQKDSF